MRAARYADIFAPRPLDSKGRGVGAVDAPARRGHTVATSPVHRTLDMSAMRSRNPWIEPARLALLALGLLAGLCVAWALLSPPNHDVAWTVYAGERVLRGDRLYVDVLEVNPPLIVWYAALAAALGRLLPGLGALHAYTLLTCLVVLAALAAARRTLPERDRTWLTAVLLPALILLPAFHFGQREQLVAAALLPYLAAVWARADGRDVRRGDAILAGALAAFGLALKPFFLLVPLLLEAWLARRRGVRIWRRPEAAAAVVGLVAYAVSVPLLTPAYLGLAPLLALYRGFVAPPLWLIARRPGTLIALAGVGAAMLPGGSRELRPLRTVWALAIAGSLAAVFVQGKGFEYHFIPAIAFSLASLATALVALARVEAVRRVTVAAVVAAALALALARLPAAVTQWRDMALAPFYMPQLAALLRALPPGPVYALTADGHIAWPLVAYTGRAWSGAMPWQWPLWSLYGDARCWTPCRPFPYHAAPGEAERLVLDDAERALRRRPPVLLIVTTEPPTGMAGFDYLEYFSRRPAFARALRAYRRIGTLPGYDLYVPRGVTPAVGTP